jgi:hypothetical protein
MGNRGYKAVNSVLFLKIRMLNFPSFFQDNLTSHLFLSFNTNVFVTSQIIMNQYSIRFNDLEIPHPPAGGFGMTFFWAQGGRKKRRFDQNLFNVLNILFRNAASSFPLFPIKSLSSRMNPPFSFTDI